MSRIQKSERKYETIIKDGSADLTQIWLEVVKRIKRGGNYAKRR